MKKYIHLKNEREKLEVKIAELLSKFSKKNGIIITNIDPQVKLEENKTEPIFLYNVIVTGEI